MDNDMRCDLHIFAPDPVGIIRGTNPGPMGFLVGFWQPAENAAPQDDLTLEMTPFARPC